MILEDKYLIIKFEFGIVLFLLSANHFFYLGKNKNAFLKPLVKIPNNLDMV